MTLSWPCAALRDEPLAPRTTMRVGGRAEWLLEPRDPDELVRAWCAALEHGFTPRVLGGGANLLVDDGTHPGVVVATDRMSSVFRPHRDEGEGWEPAPEGARAPGEEPELVAWAGLPIPRLVRVARDLGWTGLEGLVGIPGNAGGATAMNAGGRWGDMWDVVRRVRVLTPAGEVEERALEDCNPRYRDGNLGGAIVLGVHLVLERGEPATIRAAMQEYLAAKSAAQPVTERSSGCIFKNPDPELSDGRSAGRLVEDCGGKGRSRGAAVVSEKHGNFIVNRGNATAADVHALIGELRVLVRERAGVELEREVKVWRARSDEG